eukprot:6809431-Lingulodinium_polyedra.AAC.1
MPQHCPLGLQSLAGLRRVRGPSPLPDQSLPVDRGLVAFGRENGAVELGGRGCERLRRGGHLHMAVRL